MLAEIHSHYCCIGCIITVYLVYCLLSVSWSCYSFPATAVDSEKPETKSSTNSGGLSDSASILDIVRWHQWNNLGACTDIKFFGGHIWRSSRTHRDVMDGHKALCFDKNIRPLPGNCLIYSFGINSDWSYDADLAEYGCEVHSFDPSIDEPPQIGRNKFYFHKIGLDGRDYVNRNGWQMMTLKSIMKFLGHENRIVDAIKMDIEESEYEVVPNMILTGVLEKIKQIAIETHNFSMEEKDRKRYIEKFRQILKLEKFGFIRFSSQPAMNTDLLNDIAKMSDFFCYEIAWYNPKFYKK